jgi:hypothetical protein
MGKRGLQVAMALLGVIPILTGLVTMFGLSDPIYASAGIPPNALLDSNLRFYGGVWLGLGVALYWLIPNVERQTLLFRVLWGMIFLGGVGRLMSMVFLALPPLAVRRIYRVGNHRCALVRLVAGACSEKAQ